MAADRTPSELAQVLRTAAPQLAQLAEYFEVNYESGDPIMGCVAELRTLAFGDLPAAASALDDVPFGEPRPAGALTIERALGDALSPGDILTGWAVAGQYMTADGDQRVYLNAMPEQTLATELGLLDYAQTCARRAVQRSYDGWFDDGADD